MLLQEFHCYDVSLGRGHFVVFGIAGVGKGMIRIIPGSEILYVEADDDYIRIFTAGTHYLKKATLSHLEQTLDPDQFVRVHRSYLVPVSQLLRIEPYEKDGHLALLHCGMKVPVSKSGFSRLKNILGW